MESIVNIMDRAIDMIDDVLAEFDVPRGDLRNYKKLLKYVEQAMNEKEMAIVMFFAEALQDLAHLLYSLMIDRDDENHEMIKKEVLSVIRMAEHHLTDYAAEKRRLDVFEWLAEHGVMIDKTILMNAEVAQDLEMVRLLVMHCNVPVISGAMNNADAYGNRKFIDFVHHIAMA